MWPHCSNEPPAMYELANVGSALAQIQTPNWLSTGHGTIWHQEYVLGRSTTRKVGYARWWTQVLTPDPSPSGSTYT